jgi:CRP/FNR family cyclic AMP-dependent transcriptional regulator
MAESVAVKQATLTLLKSSNWFRGIQANLLHEITAVSVQRRYGAGETVFNRDEPGDHLFGVISGSIRVTTQAADGRELALNTMKAGDLIGEISVLDGGTRTASGHALEPTVVFVIPRRKFKALMLRQPKIALHMIALLCERVRRTSAQVEEAAFLSLSERLARLLETLDNEAGAETCVVKITQSELASFLNASRQAVNGCLGVWQKEGLISLGRGRIEIHQLGRILAR